MVEKIELLRLHERSIDYEVPVPERLKKDFKKTTIEIKLVKGEYRYITRSHTFNNDVGMVVEELQAIIDELNKLNKE